jgi:hypothetical protein
VDLRYREEAKDIFSPGSWISLFENLKFEKTSKERGAKVVPLTDVKLVRRKRTSHTESLEKGTYRKTVK